MYSNKTVNKIVCNAISKVTFRDCIAYNVHFIAYNVRDTNSASEGNVIDILGSESR